MIPHRPLDVPAVDPGRRPLEPEPDSDPDPEPPLESEPPVTTPAILHGDDELSSTRIVPRADGHPPEGVPPEKDGGAEAQYNGIMSLKQLSIAAGDLSIGDMVKCCSDASAWNEFVTELVQDWDIPRKRLGRVHRMYLEEEFKIMKEQQQGLSVAE